MPREVDLPEPLCRPADVATAEVRPRLSDQGIALAWRNRPVLARRLAWPPDAVDLCEEVERRYPGWYPNYSHGDSWERPERGYYAVPWEEQRYPPRAPVFGADADALVGAIGERERNAGFLNRS